MHETKIMKSHAKSSVSYNYFILKCVFQQFLISYIFSDSRKFGVCYIKGQWGEFRTRIKNTTIYLLIYFFGIFCIVCHCKTYVFTIFDSFYEVSSFRNRILTTQKQELMIRNCQWSCTFLSFNLNKCLDFETMALSFLSLFQFSVGRHFTIVFSTILYKPLILFLYIFKFAYYLSAKLSAEFSNKLFVESNLCVRVWLIFGRQNFLGFFFHY